MNPEFETYLTDTVKDGAGDNTWKAARVALGLCREYDHEDFADAIRDGMVEIRHLCDALGLDLSRLGRDAHAQYTQDRTSNGPIATFEVQP